MAPGGSGSEQRVRTNSYNSNSSSIDDWTQLVISVVLAVVSTAVMTWHVRRQKREFEGNNRDDEEEEEQQHEEPLILQAFEQAATRIRSHDISSLLDDQDKLLVYALYKQATIGNAPTLPSVSLSTNLMTAQVKHHAWSRLRSMPRQAARLAYIQVVQEMEEYYSTGGTTSRNDGDGDMSSDGDMGGFGVSVSRPMMSLPSEHHAGGADSSLSSSPTHELFQAAAQNKVDTLQSLLTTTENDDVNRLPLDVNLRDENGQTALHVAADQGHGNAVACLLQHGSLVNASDTEGISVLQTAVMAGHTNVCKLLLEAGADPDQADADGETSRSCALDDGTEEMQALFATVATE